MFQPRARVTASGVWLAAVVLTAGCGGSSAPGPASPQTPTVSQAQAGATVSLDKNAYPVFPDADAGADPSVSAEAGGRGFTAQGWQTSTDYELIGDPRAVKGGVFREEQPGFPGTLRIYGPEANTLLNGMIQGQVYETLLSVHPSTLEFIPALATHWQISADKLTYRFRINPNARFSNGEPVTSDDVIASWALVMDKGLQEPMSQLVFAKFDKPVAESKYIVRVKCNQLNWRNFLYFAGSLPILPSSILRTTDGAAYVRDYNFKLLPGTGPYTVRDADVVKGKSLSLRRRPDYWAAHDRRSIGTANFDEIRETVVRDENLSFEMFKKGDLDYYSMDWTKSRQWAQELNFDKTERGLILKAKVHNDNPLAVRGMAFNTRKAPFDDIRVREALTYLFNRKLLIEKLFYNEFVPLNSHYAGWHYENPGNPTNDYNPALALKLLADAGWKDRDTQGRLVRNGQPLTVEVLYDFKSMEPFLTTYQDDLRKVGIGLSLRLVTPETQFQLIMERKFDLSQQAWTGLTFPNPETSYSSKLADVNNTNNVTGFKNARVDALLDLYDREFDQDKRIAIVREIDGIVSSSHQYILEWDMPFQRIAYWNRFGHPDGYLTRIGDYTDMPSLWWIDPKKAQLLSNAIADPSVKLPLEPIDILYWPDYDKRVAAQAQAAPTPAPK
jgi:microcin C transport system substrate-binding protein